MAAANIIQLRELLREKFPGFSGQVLEHQLRSPNVWPSRLEQIDALLHGGLPKGSLSEIVCARPGSGSASLMRWLLERAAEGTRFAALIDGADSFDVTQASETALARLLWVRCRSAGEALKAADLLLRDGNVPFVLLDLVLNSKAQLRTIPPTVWYRFQRILEQTSTVCAVFTPSAMVGPAQARLALNSRFSLNALENTPDDSLRKLEVSEGRRLRELAHQNFA